MKLIFATNNPEKVKEIRAVIKNDLQVISLKEAGINIDIPEPYDTLEDNARNKSRVIYELTGLDCFSEDTGLEVAALNGEPGVRSARYSGDKNLPDANIEKLLINLAGIKDRSAQFRTIISVLTNGKETQFEGICRGTILSEKRGNKGFGYDPVFVPEGSERSFAEMDLAEKNKYSHRKKAIEKLVSFLNNLSTNH